MKVCIGVLGAGLLLVVSACAAAGMTISDAKLLPDGSAVSLMAKVVTYAAADVFYIEESLRTCGIRVEKTAHGLAVGDRADVTGTISTNAAKERFIAATSAAKNASGTIAPIGVRNGALGGGDWHYDSGTHAGQKGVSGSLGLNTIGLLVETWGRFEQIDGTTFTLDDGSGLDVKCTVTRGFYLDPVWEYVGVVGASSMYESQGSLPLPCVLVRDVRVFLPVETVSTPGTPDGYQFPYVNTMEIYSTTGSTSSLGHTIEYSFDWGGGAPSPWSASTSASHSWSTAGSKTVTVTARCQTHPSISATSPGLSVYVQDANPIEMIYIPAGSFLMGNNGNEPDCWPDELPQHSVHLSGYWISKYEVSRGEYQQFMDAGGYMTNAYWSYDGWAWKTANGRTQPNYWAEWQYWSTPPGLFRQTPSHPAAGVTYYEAEAFCNWAGGHLPTEAQCEKAARWTGIHPNVYPWGDTWDPEKCNYFYDSLYPGYQTAPVGSYPSGASPYGCQDMAGNVWEWCMDWYDENYYSQTPPGGWSDPQGPSSGSDRVLRGGSWYNSQVTCCRCAFRTSYAPNSTFWGSFGFRLAR